MMQCDAGDARDGVGVSPIDGHEVEKKRRSIEVDNE